MRGRVVGLLCEPITHILYFGEPRVEISQIKYHNSQDCLVFTEDWMGLGANEVKGQRH